MNKEEFQEAIRMLYSKEPLIYEDGYMWLIGHVDKYLEEITTLMQNQTNSNLRGKLIELLGHSKNEKVIPVLSKELSSVHRDLRFWAYSQLSYIENPKAQELVERYRIKNPNEDWY